MVYANRMPLDTLTGKGSVMTKTEMVAAVLHASGFNSDREECIAFARDRLVEEAGSLETFRQWNTQISNDFASQYIKDRSSVTSVRWDNLYKELA